MTRTIEPALTPDEWVTGEGYGYLGGTKPERIPGCIAILNAMLPDSDPRKITHARIELLLDRLSWLCTQSAPCT